MSGECRRAVVVAHVRHHDNEYAKSDDPPWTRTLRFDDGSEQDFDWRHLCRNCTFARNTDVGAVVWVDERGGISAAK